MYLALVSKHKCALPYDVTSTDATVMSYFSGFVSDKTHITKYSECISSLQSESSSGERDKLIDIGNQDLINKNLLYPSDDLFNLLFKLELTILDIAGKCQMNCGIEKCTSEACIADAGKSRHVKQRHGGLHCHRHVRD